MLVFLIKLIGLVLAGFGLTIAVSPKFIQKAFAFMKEGKRIYGAGVFRCVAGFLLIFAASKSLVPLAAVALGTVLLLSGLLVFALDVEKIKGFLTHYSEMNVPAIRLLGLVAASFGILIFSIV